MKSFNISSWSWKWNCYFFVQKIISLMYILSTQTLMIIVFLTIYHKYLCRMNVARVFFFYWYVLSVEVKHEKSYTWICISNFKTCLNTCKQHTCKYTCKQHTRLQNIHDLNRISLFCACDVWLNHNDSYFTR